MKRKQCDYCGKSLYECDPHFEQGGLWYCGECAFKLSKLSEKQFLKDFRFFIGVTNLKAAVNPDTGEIEVTNLSKFSWQRPNKDYRKTKQYREWRTNVFTRDSFACAICGQVGGNLEAHHIKPFSKYKNLRFTTSNGITLCKKCHKKVHKEKNNEWLHTS